MVKHGELQKIIDAVDPNNHAEMIATLQQIVIEMDKVLISHHERMNQITLSNNNNTNYFIEIFKSMGVDFVNADSEKDKMN
jgi:ribosomal protein L4